MIPGTWLPYRRGDGELVGYLAPVEPTESAEAAQTVQAAGTAAPVEPTEPMPGALIPAQAGVVSPRSLIGTPLGPPAAPEAAAKLLTARGLAVLAEKWWCRLPKPLVPDIDVTAPDPAWPWRPVVLVEVGPGGASARIAMPWAEEKTVQVRIPIPVDGVLRTLPPE